MILIKLKYKTPKAAFNIKTRKILDCNIVVDIEANDLLLVIYSEIYHNIVYYYCLHIKSNHFVCVHKGQIT